MKSVVALICALMLSLCACSTGAAEETVTGMVTAVEGTQVTLLQMDSNMELPQSGKGERPSGFGGREGNTDGTRPAMPEGGFEQFGGGEMPEFGEMPTMPEGETMPQSPEGAGDFKMPEGETTVIDLADAHISVTFDGGKATGSMEDIKQGAWITVTLVDGKATGVTVSQTNGFGGRGNFGFGKPDQKPQQNSTATLPETT